MRRLKSLVCDEDGAELVEFAVASTIFFALIFGFIEFCMVAYASNSIALAAQQGARYAMVRGSDWTSACATTTGFSCATTATNVTNYIRSQTYYSLNMTSSGPATITVTPLLTRANGTACSAWSQGCRVEVQITYPYGLKLPYVPVAASSISLSGASIETIQN
jgi:Flp pilus assembly protein TadG